MERTKRSTTKKKTNSKSSEPKENDKDLETHLSNHQEKDNIEGFSKLLLKSPKRCLHFLQAKMKDVYAVEQSGKKWIRSSKIVPLNVGFEMSTLESRIPTPNAIQIPVDTLLSAISGQAIIYLGIGLETMVKPFLGRISICDAALNSTKKKPFGRVRILLTCGPKRKAQMLSLCVGQGVNTLRGSWFDKASMVGMKGERIYCNGYIAAGGMKVSKPIVLDLEQDQCKKLAEGAVTGWPDGSKFCICTTGNPSSNDMLPEIGQVIAGLDILRKAIRSNDTEMIHIVEAGIEFLNY